MHSVYNKATKNGVKSFRLAKISGTIGISMRLNNIMVISLLGMYFPFMDNILLILYNDNNNIVYKVGTDKDNSS